MATFNHDHFKCSFQNWISQQHKDLEELLNTIATNPTVTNENLKVLGDKAIKHFEEYYERRTMMAKHDAPSFLSPIWCSSFENAFLWVGGCRPTLSVRLVYSVCGSELDGFLKGERRGNLAEISGEQLKMIDALHCKTVREEDKISGRMASLQEEIADEPLAMIAKNAGRVGEWSQDVTVSMDSHSLSLASMIAEADRLRLSTMKELMDILTPWQGVDLLVATKKLHLSMHEWGKRRDHQLGRPSWSEN